MVNMTRKKEKMNMAKRMPRAVMVTKLAMAAKTAARTTMQMARRMAGLR